MTTRVIIETPFQGASESEMQRNLQFARRCMQDSLNRGEAPVMFHMLYPQRAGGPLNDNKPEQRQRGKDAAKNWYRRGAEKVVIYDDLGITEGMKEGIHRASDRDLDIEFRTLADSDHRPKNNQMDLLDQPNQ